MAKTHMVQRSTWSFAADATYVVVGGLGGLGRAIVRWMVSKGARNVIAPSRSGLASKAAFELVSEMASRGARLVTPQCDVSSQLELHALLQNSLQLPPIKGCINSAVDLQVCIRSGAFVQV